MTSKKQLFFCFIFLFTISAIPSLHSQTARKAKVLGLSVEGNKTADANLIKVTSGLTVGTTISADDIQNAIRRLWSLDMFSDIQIILEREVGSSVYLKIKVEELPRLEKVQLEGNKKIKKKDLEKEITFFPGMLVGPAKINQVRRQMLKLYREKGYLLAEIESEILPSESEKSDRVIVRFKIREGNKVQVEKITFHGNERFSDRKLRKQMKEIKEDTWWRGADFDPEKFEEDKKLVLDFYRSEGYRDAEIVRDSLYYGPEKKDMFIDIWVNEGTRYTFGDITFEGNELYTDEQLLEIVGFKKGDTYSSKKLEESVQEKLGTLYYDAGYIYANIIPQEIPAGKDTVDIHYLINEAKAVKIRKIQIVGNTQTKDKVIRRELYMFPGQVFSKALLMRSQREVWVLNYFSNVVPNIQPVDNEHIDVVFEVEERGTSTANMSAGWSERDRIIGSVGVAMNNLFGNGQRFGFDWNFGRYYQSFQINFTEPWLFDTPTLAGFSFYDTSRDPFYIGYRQKSRGGTLRLGRRFRWPDNYFRGDWIYRIDRTELSDFSDFILNNNPSGIVTEQWPLTTSGITQIISRNSLDRVEFPTQGSKFSLSTEVAGGILGGNVGYHKHHFKAEWYTPVWWKLVFRTNFELGAINEFGSQGRIPYLDNFFLGGEGLTRSIPLRGYNDPLSGNGDRVGGRALLKYNAEIRIPVSPNPTIYLLAFAEAGNTWVNYKDVNPYRLKRSAGFGARVFMPMLGMLGFDYAYGFDNTINPDGTITGSWKPHFVFGQQF